MGSREGVELYLEVLYIVLWLDGLVDSFNYPKPLGLTTRVGDILETNPDSKYMISALYSKVA